MEKRNDTYGHLSKSCWIAILFLRIFIGGVMLLHIIGKMQSYDNLVLMYNSFLGMSPATSLILSIVVEGALATMIIIGVATRLAAMLMIAITCISFIESILTGDITMTTSKIEFLYLGIYLTLAISGGGKYAFLLPESRE